MSEQRKHQRYNAPDNTFVIADGNMCKIIDISKGGLSLMSLDGKATNIPKELSLDFLPICDIIRIRWIPGKLVWQREITFSAVSGMVYKNIGVQFGKLTPKQKAEFDELILKLHNRICIRETA